MQPLFSVLSKEISFAWSRTSCKWSLQYVSCFTILCYFLLYNKVSQLCVSGFFFFKFPSGLGHHRVLKTVTCVTIVLISYQGIIFPNIQTAHVAQYDKKKNNSVNKFTDLNRHSSKNTQMANKHLKICPTSLVTREMQIKTTMRYYFTPAQIALIKNSTNINFCGVWRKGNPLALSVGM